MKKKVVVLLVVGLVVAAAGLVVFGQVSLYDLRPSRLRGEEVSKSDRLRGRALLASMEKALGGYERWKKYKSASFTMTANWSFFPASLISNWPIAKPKFRLECVLGLDDGGFAYLNGPKKGQRWSLSKGKMYKHRKGQREATKAPALRDKIVYKSYWFQFPFRIREAAHVAYGGKVSHEGKTYLRVFATWGQMKPHKKADHFLLHLEPDTYRLRWLAFTVREKAPGVPILAKFSDYRSQGGLTLPFKQEVWFGTLKGFKHRAHENYYHSIRWGASGP